MLTWLKRGGIEIVGGMTGFGRFWHNFINGDDWTAVAAAVVVTWLRWSRPG